MHLSFWEQDALLAADCIVVGGGLVGLQTALELRERVPGANILVLERGVLPLGASTRNAGFACFGSLTEILHDLDTMGEDAALSVVEQRWRGLARLRARLGDTALGYEACGGYELLDDKHLPALDRLDELNRKLRPVFKDTVFRRDDAALRAAGFAGSIRALVANPLEGQLHAGRMMQALAGLAAQQGIRMLGGVRVDAVEEDDAGVTLVAGGPGEQRSLRFRAARVALCTNGLLQQLAPQCPVRPARGQVLLSAPVPDLPWRGSYHFDEGFYYFRNVGQRVLLGGGRNLDFVGETTADIALNDAIQHALERLLRDTLLPGKSASVECRWAGIMGFSEDKQPIVRRIGPRVAVGFGCNGMGVALGADIAARTAALLLEG